MKRFRGLASCIDSQASRDNSEPLAPSSGNMASLMITSALSLTSVALSCIFSEYLSLVMKGSLFSLFLYREQYALYSDVVLDMAFLRHNSMVICCGSGVDIHESKIFQTRYGSCTLKIDGSFVGLFGSFGWVMC